MQPAPPCSVPTYWWQRSASGLLLRWELQLGTYPVHFFFSPGYVALWDSITPHRPSSERVSWCLETSPPSWLPPRGGSPVHNSFVSLSVFYICPISFQREWTAFLGGWCPLPSFRSSFVEVALCSNDLLMNLWGRKCSPLHIPLNRTSPLNFLVLNWL